MAENKKEEKDWRAADIAALKKNFEKWRKIAAKATLFGIIINFAYWIIPIRLSFRWSSIIFFAGLIPAIGLWGTHAFKVVRPWENGVVFRESKVNRTVGPGWFLIAWPGESIAFRNMQDVKYDPPDQEVFTREKIINEQGLLEEKQMPAIVDIVFWGCTIDPVASMVNVENLQDSVLKYVTGKLRDVVSGKSFEEISANKDAIASDIEAQSNEALAAWGYRIKKVQIQSIKPSPELLKAQEQIQVASKDRETILARANIKAAELAILRKADPDLSLIGLQTLGGFKGSINVIGGTLKEIVESLKGGAKKE